MRRPILIVASVVLSGSAFAQAAPLPTVEQAGIIYDQCLARAAVRASRTDAADDAIYGLAKAECAPTRTAVVAGRTTDKPLNDFLNAIDADKAAAFPALTKQIREQRRQREAQFKAQ